jgi:hypothetical protein
MAKLGTRALVWALTGALGGSSVAAAGAAEKKRVAVLEFRGDASQKPEALALMADRVRAGVLTALRATGRLVEYDVMTRESLAVMLTEMGKGGDCKEGECEVETARNIGADLVVSGEVTVVEGSCFVTLKLHEATRGALLATQESEGKGEADLVRDLPAAASRLVEQGLGAATPSLTATTSTGSHRHGGFYLRLELGPGFLRSAKSYGDVTESHAGLAGLGGFAIGGSLAEDTLLALRLSAGIATSLVHRYENSKTASSSLGRDRTSVTSWGVGPEFTRYLMPLNLYLTASAGVTSASVDTGGGAWGWGGQVAIGKEWWLSDHWGLGAAPHASFSSNGDWATWALGLSLSATYN